MKVTLAFSNRFSLILRSHAILQPNLYELFGVVADFSFRANCSFFTAKLFAHIIDLLALSPLPLSLLVFITYSILLGDYYMSELVILLFFTKAAV